MQGRSPLSLFIEECRRNFQQTGAVAPSSRALARAMTSDISPCSSPRRILEAGAGTGVFTIEIARRMGPFDRLDVYEINPVFADHIEEAVRRDPAFRSVEGRVILHRKSVLDLPAGDVFDRIVSGLPLNNFDPEWVRTLLETFMERLTPGGVLTWFEYILLRALKRCVSGSAERERLRLVGEVTGEFIQRFEARRDAILLNLPPAVARHLVKPLHDKIPAAREARPLAPAAAVQ